MKRLLKTIQRVPGGGWPKTLENESLLLEELPRTSAKEM